MNVQRLLVILLVAAMAAVTGWTQDAAPKSAEDEKAKTEAAEAEKGSLSAEESTELQKVSGANKRFKTWEEFVEYWMTPQPFPKEKVIRIDENYAYPHIVASIKMQFVREDDQYVWLRGISPEDPNSPMFKIWARREADQAVAIIQSEIASAPGAVNYLNFFQEEVPPPFVESLVFEPVTAGMPDAGRWQMGFDIADMNEDGHLDLVFPPRRKGFPAQPIIFIGDGKGGFEPWRQVRWSNKVQWDYGDVEVADFDGDGHQDVAFAIHFKRQFLLYGDGKGLYVRGEQLPSPDPRLSSRAVTAADFDGDGSLDLAFVAEIDYDLTTNRQFEGQVTAWVLFNRGGSWKIDTAGLPTNLISDVLSAGDVDGDGRPELVLSTNTFGVRQLVYSYHKEGWRPAEHRGMLSAAYHYDVEPAAGELFATFVQFRMIGRETQARNGLVRYPLATGEDEFVAGTPIVWDKNRGDVFYRLALGDLDGDGLVDLVAGRRHGGLEAYLQTSDGKFYRESGAELDGIGRAYDIRLADLDGDGRDDIIAGCAQEGDKPGGVYVWLSKPAI